MVNEERVSFNRLEREIYQYVCAMGCAILAQALERLDGQLEQEREKSLYRHKG